MAIIDVAFKEWLADFKTNYPALFAGRSADTIIDALTVAYKAGAARQPVGEPVAWFLPSEHGYDSSFRDHQTIKSCTGNSWTGWIPLYTSPPAQAVDLAMPIAMIDRALGHLSTALDDMDSSPDPRPGAMVTEAMACLRQALTEVPHG
ncbi:TPA: hypothetical protein QEL68_000748 [Stenotrophomonas maltophilia]|nr:hypothetical protein [Stenotrophomonas maltophilia]